MVLHLFMPIRGTIQHYVFLKTGLERSTGSIQLHSREMRNGTVNVCTRDNQVRGLR